jgi:hypothetical protein
MFEKSRQYLERKEAHDKVSELEGKLAGIEKELAAARAKQERK